jgi:porin
MKTQLKLTLTALVYAAALGAASADDTTTNAPSSGLRRFLEQDYLLGDWCGWRTKLSAKGIDFEFFYAASLPDNLDGGYKRGGIYQGAALLTLDLDSEKLAGYHGGMFHVGSIWTHGEKAFSDNYVGDLNKVNLIDFSHGFRLWEMYYQQKFLDDKLTVKAGQLAIDRDFIVPEYYNSIAGVTLLNQTFFYPTMAFNVWDQAFYPKGNHGLATTPYGTPGAVVRVDPVPYAYIQAGVYDGNPDTSGSGTRVKLSSDEGALIYAELGVKVNQAKDAEGPPGNIKFGAYYHTDDFYDTYEGYWVAVDNYLASIGSSGLGVFTAATARQHSGNYGIYFLADQTLWREQGKDDKAQQGLVGFFRVAEAPKNENIAQFGVDGGLVYKGLIPSRDWDTLALGVSYLEMSREIRRAQQDINSTLISLGGSPYFTHLADYEAVIELSYKFQLAAWWTLQPSIQRVIHPGGRLLADTPDSTVFILMTTLRF